MLPYFPYDQQGWPGIYGYAPRPFPANDVTRMQSSAQSFPQLSRQAQQLTGKIQTDTAFAKRLRGAAQVNNKDEVKRLIGTIVKIPFIVSYTPDGLKVEIHPLQQSFCATLTAFVCW